MALFVQQDENRSELQKRIAAELNERAKRTAANIADKPDGVEDSAYMEGTKSTTSLAWAWILILLTAMIIAGWLIVVSLMTD